MIMGAIGFIICCIAGGLVMVYVDSELLPVPSACLFIFGSCIWPGICVWFQNLNRNRRRKKSGFLKMRNYDFSSDEITNDDLRPIK